MPVATTVKAVETLEKTKETLIKRGWKKGYGQRSSGPICVLHALNIANGPGEPEAKRIIENLIPARFTQSIPYWNDDKETTLDDVLTVLSAARHIAKELAE